MINYDDSQINAIAHACQANNSIITGHAGTGKTTVVKGLIESFGKRVIVLATTGKAAARLRDVTGFESMTIHRWLLHDGETVRRRSYEYNPVVVDEASMITSELFADILATKPPKLILVGDPAQLPPVGKGSPFHDLVKMRPDIVSELKVCHRNREAIHDAATNFFRVGKVPAVRIKTDSESYYFYDTALPERTEKLIETWVKKGVYDADKDVIITCRNGKDENESCGVKSLNAMIVKLVNPRDSEDVKWQVGDRVMNLKNVSEMDWWNGDTGTITAIDALLNLWVRPDRPGKELLLNEKLRKSLNHAYALTVHKSQGSQYRRVFFVCLKKHLHMIDRNLIYTAATRAREGLVIVGNSWALSEGLKKVNEKTTILQGMFDSFAEKPKTSTWKRGRFAKTMGF